MHSCDRHTSFRSFYHGSIRFFRKQKFFPIRRHLYFLFYRKFLLLLDYGQVHQKIFSLNNLRSHGALSYTAPLGRLCVFMDYRLCIYWLCSFIRSTDYFRLRVSRRNIRCKNKRAGHWHSYLCDAFCFRTQCFFLSLFSF